MQVTCPRCRKVTTLEGNPSRPFCSERCRLLDLGAWIDEEYAIPGEADESDDNPPTPEKPLDS